MGYKYLQYLGLIILCVIVLFTLDKYRPSQNQTSGQTQESVKSGNASSTEPKATDAAPKVIERKKLPYGEAVNTYAYRVQFSNCGGNPGSVSIKKGAVLMLDNRDNKAHAFQIGKWAIKVAGYDYALFVPAAINVGFNKILCDGGGAADLNVEL